MEPGHGLDIRRTAPGTGLPTFASSADRGILLQTPRGASAEARARNFVDVYGKAFGLGSSGEVRLVKTHVDELGLEHVRFQQVHRGVPVTGGELLIHLNGSRVMVANGHTIADLPDDILPIVPGELAESAARRLIAKRSPADATSARYSEPRLEILNRALLAGTGDDASRLAWFIEASGERLRQFIWVDARSGAILLTFSQLTDAKNRTVYSAGNSETLPGTLVRIEGGAATGNADNDNAYTFAGVTYDYFLNQHGRDSFDGAGAGIISTTHYCKPPDCPDYPNAFWNGAQMVYGNGYASADDVVGHELAHAVTERTAGLFYYQQSGALNESFSDIFGETIDLVSSAGAGNDSAGVRWQMGEDLLIGAIRNMSSPNLFGDPARMTDSNYFVCSTMGWTDSTADHGGVHSNSGVPNHAYALMVDGGIYNGKTVSAIGLTKAAKIEYRALVSYLFSGSGFLDDYDAINQSCRDLIGTAGIAAADCTQVQNALEAVEMHLPWGCSGSTQAPAMCPSGQPSVVFGDGFEVANNNWLGSTAGSGGSWMFDHGLAKTGSGMAYGNDPEAISTHTLFMFDPVVVPAGGRLYFDHLFEFENDINGNYDGGRLQYSTNNGATWLDANSLIDAGHAYDGTLAASNPMGAGLAFVGASYGYTGTRLNLAALAGQSFRFRFSIGSDEFVSSLGWLVDNFKIYSCVVPAAFTDDPLVAGTTPVKAIHITELRTRINAIRLARGLPQVLWTNSIVGGTTIVQALDITGMRTALAGAYAAAALTPPNYTDPSLGAGTAIKAIHIAQLRAAVVAIE